MCTMEGKILIPYCTTFSANQGGIDKIYYSRQAGYVVTTQHTSNGEMITRVRFDTAGCFDSNVALRSMQDGDVITVELSGPISKAASLCDDEFIIAADDYVNEYPIEMGEGFNPESVTVRESVAVQNSRNMYRSWYDVSSVKGNVTFKIPAGYKVDVSAEVLNGVAIVKFVQKVISKPKQEPQWTNLTHVKYPADAKVSKSDQSKLKTQKCFENETDMSLDLIKQLTKKYNL